MQHNLIQFDKSKEDYDMQIKRHIWDSGDFVTDNFVHRGMRNVDKLGLGFDFRWRDMTITDRGRAAPVH